MIIDNPNIMGKTPEENIKFLQRWATRAAQTMNYNLSHLDRDAFVESERPITQQELKAALDEQAQTIRAQYMAAIKAYLGE